MLLPFFSLLKKALASSPVIQTLFHPHLPTSPDYSRNRHKETNSGTCQPADPRSAKWRGRSCSTVPRGNVVHGVCNLKV